MLSVTNKPFMLSVVMLNVVMVSVVAPLGHFINLPFRQLLKIKPKLLDF